MKGTDIMRVRSMNDFPGVGSARSSARAHAARRLAAAVTLALAGVLGAPAGLARAGGSGSALELAIGHNGIAFGPAPRVNGLRINFSDDELERVNGLNFTVWNPGGDVGGEVNGLALGLVGPSAARLHGVQLGLGAVVANERLVGISAAGLAVVSEGERFGVAAAGLAVVSEGSSAGVGAGGLAVVSEGDLRGLYAGGLATVSEGEFGGIGFGTLATVVEGRLRGIGVGGLATVSDGPLEGLGIGGLAVVSSQDLRGIAVAGLGVASGRTLRGIAVAGGAVSTEDLLELSVAPYNRYVGIQRGIAIGIYNSANELRGVQIGVLNRAGNHRPPFRYVPLLNFDFN